MKRLCSSLHTLALFVFIALLLILFLEVILRTVTRDKGKDIHVGNFAYAYHPWAASRATPGFSTGPMTINKYGWRGKEHDRKKPAGTRRVLLLGDSVAFSSPELHEEAIIAGYLQAALTESDGQVWEVINMAVPGGTGAKALATLAHEGIHFEPDVVVALNGANDLVPLTNIGPNVGIDPFSFVAWDGVHSQMQRLLDPRTGRGTAADNLTILVQESALYRYMSKSFSKWLPKRPPQEWPAVINHPEMLQPFIDGQIAIHYLARGAGAVFIHYVQPYLSLRHRKRLDAADRDALKVHETAFGATYPAFIDQGFPILRDKMQEAAQLHGFKCVDLSLLLIDEEHPFSDTVHTTYASSTESAPNKKIARAMADAILSALGLPRAS